MKATLIILCLLVFAPLAQAQDIIVDLPGGGPGAGGGGSGSSGSPTTATQAPGTNHAEMGRRWAYIVGIGCLVIEGVVKEGLKEDSLRTVLECTAEAGVAFAIGEEVSRGLSPAVGGGLVVGVHKVVTGEFSEGKALNSSVKVLADTACFAAIASLGPPGWVALVLGMGCAGFVEKVVDEAVPQTPPDKKGLAKEAKLPDG